MTLKVGKLDGSPDIDISILKEGLSNMFGQLLSGLSSFQNQLQCKTNF